MPIHLLDILLHLLLLILIIAPLILQRPLEHIPRQNSHDQKDPKDIHGLQAREQGEGDPLGNPALVLLRDPVELEGADGREFPAWEERDQDFEVDEVPHVQPDADEGDEVGDREDRVEVVQDFGGL